MLPGFITSPARYNEGVAAQSSITFTDSGSEIVIGGNSVTISGRSFGAAQDDRLIYACIGTEGNSILRANVSSVTIGGRPANFAHFSENLGASPDLVTEIWYANVPIGTTGDIVVNFVGTTTANICTYIFRGVNIYEPVFATANNATSTGTNISTTINVPALGSVIAFVVSAADTGSYTWTNITERSDLDIGGYTTSCAGGDLPAGDSSRTITAASISAAKCLVAISMR